MSSPRDLPDPGIKPAPPASPALQVDSFIHWVTWEVQEKYALNPYFQFWFTASWWKQVTKQNNKTKTKLVAFRTSFHIPALALVFGLFQAQMLWIPVWCSCAPLWGSLGSLLLQKKVVGPMEMAISFCFVFVLFFFLLGDLLPPRGCKPKLKIWIKCILLDFPGDSVDQRIHLQCRSCRRCRFDPWVRKIPWRGHGNPL